MHKVQVAATLVITLHPPHTSKVDLRPMEHGGNTVRGSCGLVERVSKSFPQELFPFAFKALVFFHSLRCVTPAVTSAPCAESAEDTRPLWHRCILVLYFEIRGNRIGKVLT